MVPKILAVRFGISPMDVVVSGSIRAWTLGFLRLSIIMLSLGIVVGKSGGGIDLFSQVFQEL